MTEIFGCFPLLSCLRTSHLRGFSMCHFTVCHFTVWRFADLSQQDSQSSCSCLSVGNHRPRCDTHGIPQRISTIAYRLSPIDAFEEPKFSLPIVRIFFEQRSADTTEGSQNDCMRIDFFLTKLGSAKFAIFDFLSVSNDLCKLCPV